MLNKEVVASWRRNPGSSLPLLLQAMMEEIAGFEDRLDDLKTKGDTLIGQCPDHLQAKQKQSVQAHLQGTKDSYSAICSTAQRVSAVDTSPQGRTKEECWVFKKMGQCLNL